MSVTRKALLTLCLLFGLSATGSLIVITLPDDTLFDQSSVLTCYLLVLAVVFYFYMRWVLIEGAVRDNLLWCGILFIAMFLIRGAKYIAFLEMDHVRRYLWYFYYIPLLYIPFFSFRAAISVGKPEEMKSPKWHWILGAMSTVLVVLVVTNDIHQWAFHLNPGFREHWIDRYTYGPLYYIIYAWIATVLLSSLFIMFRKCSIASCRKQVWAPIISGAFGIFCLIMIVLDGIPRVNGHRIVQFPEAFCFTVAACWVCCTQIGLIPANRWYTELFRISNIRAVITDNCENIIYRSRAVVEQSEQKEIRTQRKAIQGGYVSWQTDVTKINRINAELDAIHRQLEEETELLRLENNLKEQNKILEEKNALYDGIALRVRPQSEKISELSAITEESGEQRNHNLRMICLYGCYIKRMSNLMLIAAQQPLIGEMELALAAGETMHYMQQFGVSTAVIAEESDRSYDAETIIRTYEMLEQYIEETLPYLQGVQLTIARGLCRLTLECSEVCALPEHPGVAIQWDEETAFLTISLGEGRDLA